MNEDASNTAESGAGAHRAQLEDIPKTVRVDTAKLQERQRQRRSSTPEPKGTGARSWGMVLGVLAVLIVLAAFLS